MGTTCGGGGDRGKRCNEQNQKPCHRGVRRVEEWQTDCKGTLKPLLCKTAASNHRPCSPRQLPPPPPSPSPPILQIEAVAGLRHPNVVRLLGFCVEYDSEKEQQEQIVVYEFVSGGDLKCRMLSGTPSSWRVRGW